MTVTFIKASAVFTHDRHYRWTLDRRWDLERPRALVCGANPSDAGEVKMDPTMHRVVALLDSIGYGAFTMVNASPFVASDPQVHEFWKRGMLSSNYARFHEIRNENLARIAAAAAEPGTVIAAWGNLVKPVPPDLLAALSGNGTRPIMCWGKTKDGAPLHPLARGRMRIADGTPLVEWRRPC